MRPAPFPPDEEARLEALRSTGVLDTPPEADFDDLARLASRICGTPIALVSLVDSDRQWFKARVGTTATQTPRDVAFCAHAILGTDVFVVADALRDERFHDNPLVIADPKVRFYAGAPLVSDDGHALGSFCVIDHVPRELAPEQIDALRALGRQVVTQLELRRKARDLARRQEMLLRSDREARAATRRLEELLDGANDFIIGASPDGRLVFANRACRQALGYSSGEIARVALEEIVAPESRLGFLSRVQAIRRGEEPAGPIEVVFRSRDGRRVHAEGSLGAGRDGDEGGIVRGMFRDLTARKLAEDDLATLFDVSPDLLCIVGLDGHFKRVNPAWTRTLGWTERELMTRAFIDLVHPDDAAATLDQLARLADRGLPASFESRCRCRDGSCRWLSWTAAPADPRGLAIVSARDVTEKKALDLALRETTMLQRAILDSANYAVISTAVDGTIRVFNRAAERLLGYRADEVVGRATPEVFLDPTEIALRAAALSTELRTEVDAGFEALVAKARIGVPDENRWTYVRKDGTTFPVLLSVTTLRDGEGGVDGYIAIASDITERDAADRLKDEFVSTVSHELRTPLTSIRGSLKLLEGGVAGELESQALELVRIAGTNAERLIRIVNDILDLEKISAGKLELELGRLTPGDLADAALDGIRGMAELAGVEVAREVRVQAEVLGDDGRLVQVLTNLLSNAVKFSPAGARVDLVVESTASGRVRFSVTDRGPGIAPEHLPKLFGRFQQVDATDARRKGGTGLGLAISKSIVAQHGGEIGVSSEVGRGSTFWLELPALVDTGFWHPSPDAIGDGPRVLLLEDDRDLSRLLARTLAPYGFRLDRAETIAQAEALLATRVPAAILVDVGLPDGNGLEFTARLRERQATLDVPVVILSGREPDAPLFGAPRVVDWLTKPFDERRLLTALRFAVRKPGAPRVLLVEDDPSTRAVLFALLGRLGIRCVEASSGLAAIQAVRAEPPDLIVLDLTLEGLDGFQVVEILRQEPARATPLIVYTGRDLDPKERDALTLGVSRHLTKARVSEEELLRVVAEMLNGLLAEIPEQWR